MTRKRRSLIGNSCQFYFTINLGPIKAIFKNVKFHMYFSNDFYIKKS